MDRSSTEKSVREFIEERFLVTINDGAVTSETDLFRAGIIDSFGFIELVSYIEKHFGVKVPDEALTGGSLSSVAAIIAFLTARL